MKQIKINAKCNQCGICVVKCPEYFAENENGDVRVIAPSVDVTSKLTSAINACPVKAIELGAEVDSKQNIRNYLNELEKMKNGITVTRSDIEFNEVFYTAVSVPYAGMSDYSYRSSSQAERAGYDAFVSRSYSQIDNVILERITEYRMAMIKPYYTTDHDSAYAKNNRKVSELLKAIAVSVKAGKLPSDFCTVDVCPDTNNVVWQMLNRGEIISNNFISKVKKEFSYSASEYKTYIDSDDMEDYRGRDVYCYKAGDASRELGRDLGNALKWAKRDIEEGALDYVKSLVETYNKNLKACLERKISAVKKILM